MSRPYNPAPTLNKFHWSNAFVRGVMGPFGSGKSTAMVVEILLRAGRQRAVDGVRQTRWAIIRNTYPELKSTTIKTWQDWVPPSVCRVVYDSPIVGKLQYHATDGTAVDAEVYFISLDKPQDISKLLSLELTGAWLNEAKETPKAVLDAVTARVGRYPSKDNGGCTWKGVIADTNPPDDDHWWYSMAEVEKPDGWEFWKQPPALVRGPGGTWTAGPDAENIDHLNGGYDYYLALVPGKSPDWLKIYIEGKYASLVDGRPVLPEFNESVHVPPVAPAVLLGSPLYLGWDFGLTPACVIGQISPRGQLLIHAEIVSESIGIRNFARNAVKPLLLAKYPGARCISTGDPAGAARAQTDERTCFEELADAGLPTDPAPTNIFTARRECLAGFLSRLSDGKPAFQLSPACNVLRRGLAGRYRFRRLQVSGEERYTDVPEKNSYSHPVEALMYLAMACDPVLASRNAGAGARYQAPAVTVRGWT